MTAILRIQLAFFAVVLSSCGDDPATTELVGVGEAEEEVHSSVFTNDGDELVSSVLRKVEIVGNGQSGILIDCQIELDNNTGETLTVVSNFYSAYDTFELIVTDSSNRLIVQQPYWFHQSPYDFEGRKFPVREGRNEATLRFPLQREISDTFPRDIRVRLIGTLPESGYARTLSTNTLDATIGTQIAEPQR